MHSATKAALQAGGALIVDAVKLVYPTETYRFISAGFATINGEDYEDDHPAAALSAVEEYADGGDDEAPRNRISLLARSAAAQTALVAPAAQWSRVYCWWAALDPQTGLLIGEAERPFIGRVDVPDVEISKDAWSVVLDCASGLDQALDEGEGHRLSDTFQQLCWPGELGLSFVTGVSETVWWGTNPPRGTGRTVGGGGSGGGLFGRMTSEPVFSL